MQKSILWGALATALGVTVASQQIHKIWSRKRRLAHESQSEETYRSASIRILILGAGFGGLSTALQLEHTLDREHTNSSILVIDRNNDMLFTPLLWTVANGRTSPNNVVVPIRNFQRGRHFHVLHAEVEVIDLERKEVKTSAGVRPYDVLVIALGSHTAIPNLPGLREHAFPFHTPADALQLRNHLIDAIEAAHQTTDPKEKQEWLTFMVGGAGDTGVELAAIIHDYINTGLFKEYPWLEDEPIRVIVVGRAQRVLPMSDERTSNLVLHTLVREGIEVMTGAEIKVVTENSVETTSGTIAARNLFWAAGITAADILRQLPVEHARNGALIVDQYLRIPGYDHGYVIGDSSWAYDSLTQQAVPPTAQAARQQGHYIAQAIAAQCSGNVVEPYRYTTLGHLALLGHYMGVAEIGHLAFDGLTAWFLWHVVYLLRNPSWIKRIRLVVDWILTGILGREIGQLRLGNQYPHSAP